MNWLALDASTCDILCLSQNHLSFLPCALCAGFQCPCMNYQEFVDSYYSETMTTDILWILYYFLIFSVIFFFFIKNKKKNHYLTGSGEEWLFHTKCSLVAIQADSWLCHWSMHLDNTSLLTEVSFSILETCVITVSVVSHWKDACHNPDLDWFCHCQMFVGHEMNLN